MASMQKSSGGNRAGEKGVGMYACDQQPMSMSWSPGPAGGGGGGGKDEGQGAAGGGTEEEDITSPPEGGAGGAW